jgi:hypothetical protein
LVPQNVEPTDEWKQTYAKGWFRANQPGFKDEDGYPVWQQLGFASWDDLSATVEWTTHWNRSIAKLEINFRYYYYTVRPPVVSDEHNTLIYNFYPDPAQIKQNSVAAKQATALIDESDQRLFTFV